jgi:hypothetical protein
VNDAFQIFDGHNMVKIPVRAKLSPANMTVRRAPAVLRRERRRVCGALKDKLVYTGEHRAKKCEPRRWVCHCLRGGDAKRRAAI